MLQKRSGSFYKKGLLLLMTMLVPLLAAGCGMTEEKLDKNAARRLQKMTGFYAELEAVVYSPEGTQVYQVRQWLKKPAQWRVEVDADVGRQVFIRDGENVSVYQPDIGDYYRLTGEAAGELSPPFLLPAYLEAYLKAQNRMFMGQRRENGSTFYLVSYELPKRSETVQLRLDVKTLLPLRVETYLHGELLNRLTSSHFEVNPDFPEGLFEYDANRGAEVSSRCLMRPLSLDEARQDWPYPVYAPHYLPEGCFLFVISQSEEDGQEQLVFVYKGEEHFSFVQQPKSASPFYRAEFTKEVRIAGKPGYFHENRSGGLATLWWWGGTTEFILSGSLSQAEMLRIAESVKVSDSL